MTDAADKPPRRRPGRPKDVDVPADKAESLLKHLETGASMASWLRKHKVSSGTITKWKQRDPRFRKHFVRARREGDRVLHDEILDIADAKPKDMLALKHAALRIESRLKILANRDPSRYGQRGHMKHEHKGGGVMLQVVTGVPPRDEAPEPGEE